MAGERNIQALHVLKAMQRQDSEKASLGAAQGDYSDVGPPGWNRAQWDAFKAQYGFYPFGWQHGTRVMPPTFEGAPDWVYELLEMRRPPVQVDTGRTYWTPQ
jgi:hypothetical protein